MRYRCVALGYRLTLCIKFTAAPVSSSAWNRQPRQTNPLETQCLLHAPRLLGVTNTHIYLHAHNQTHKASAVYSRGVHKGQRFNFPLQSFQVTCMKLKQIWFFIRWKRASTQTVLNFWKKFKNRRWQDTTAMLNYGWWPFIFPSLIRGANSAFKFIFTYQAFHLTLAQTSNTSIPSTNGCICPMKTINIKVMY